MTDFEPELGQLGFSNSPWQDKSTPRWITAGILQIDDALCEALGDAQDGWNTYCSNSGRGEFVNEVFAIRSYCWCDGGAEGHEEGCPPNFEHFGSGIRAAWYKRAQRGESINRIPSKTEWRSIVRECEDAAVATPSDAGES
jgi:hypothetical protein